MTNEPAKKSTGWTPAQLEKISKWLTEKWGADRLCAQCGVMNWEVGDMPTLLPDASPDVSMFSPHNVYPLIVVFCQNCGNTVLVNSLVAGVEPPDAEVTGG